MKQLFNRLILCYLLLVIPVLLLSMLVSKNISIIELLRTRLLATFYIFAIKDILMRLVPSILAIGYAFVLFRTVKDHPKRQLIMILNSFCMMALSVIAGIVVYFYTSWFDGIVSITFTQTMVIIGLLTIILAPVFAKFEFGQQNSESKS